MLQGRPYAPHPIPRPCQPLFLLFLALNITGSPVAGFLAAPHPSKLRISPASVVGVNLCVLVGALVAGRSWGSVLRRLRTICTNVAVLGAETDLPIVPGPPRGRAKDASHPG